MNLEEFYARIGGNYADTVRRLCNDALVTRFVMKYPQIRPSTSCVPR